MEATASWLKLAGEAFWLLSDHWLLPGGVRDPFLIAPPASMRHLVTQDAGKLLGWRFRDGAGHEHVLLPEQVVHLRLWNPYDPVRGCPEWAGARLAAEADYAANLARSNGSKGPIIASKATLSDPQMAQIEAALRAKQAALRAGTIKTVFLPADVVVQDPQVTSVDAAFLDARTGNKRVRQQPGPGRRRGSQPGTSACTRTTSRRTGKP